jgi:hypothetical protein
MIVNFLWALLCAYHLFPALALVCDPANASQCGRQFCDFPVVARPVCEFNWPSDTSEQVDFMCQTSSLQGTCRACPPGWTASGAFCVECDPLKSCDRNGTAACDGACAPERYPTCDSAIGRVNCEACQVNQTSLAAQRRSLTRGGVLDAPDLCAAYFECYTGYYLSARSDNGALECLPCEFPEVSAAGRAFVSRGLTFGDKYSCMYAPLRPRRNNNSVGEYGVPLRSCPVGMTSEPGMALAEADCVACPRRPQYGSFQLDAFDCRPACADGYELRGEACVPADLSALDCDADGYALGETGCVSVPLPWNSVGWQGTDRVASVVQPHAGEVTFLDEAGDFRILRGTGALARPGVADFCEGLRAVLENKGYVQDKPLFTQACGDVEAHKMYMLASGEKYLYVFLERSFGNNNRFVMWQVQKTATTPRVGNPGQVWQTFRMPARACSAVVVPGDVVYLALCDSTFVSFAAQPDFMAPQPSPDVDNWPFYVDRTQYVLGRRLGVLIGQEEAGNRDGMLSQALFKGPLSLAKTSDTHRLFVADTGNCRIAEVVVDSPGSFYTRATTVGAAACFSGDFPLPYPRGIVSVLGGAAALFLTDSGLVQLDSKTRRFQVVLSRQQLAEQAMPEPDWVRVESDGERLVLANRTHSAVVTRVQVQCLAGYASKRGGQCSACVAGTYSAGGTCVPCTQRTCSASYMLIECTSASDSRCAACTGAVPYPFRYGSECQIIPKYPCPPDFYGLDDCLPCSAAGFRRWPGHAYCQCLGLPLGANASCDVANPWPQSPAWLSQFKCEYDMDDNCSLQGCYLAHVQPRQCTPCPAQTFSDNGLYCSSCPGYREPSPAQDACVCKAPAAASADGQSCVCPAGHAAPALDRCDPCPANAFKAETTLLHDDIPVPANGACTPCPPGQESAPGATACMACQAGKYREANMSACDSCPVGMAYAADPATSSSCVQCTTQCDSGQRWKVCPVNASFYTCSACPRLGRFREWIPESRSCDTRCKAGFYEYNKKCFPCTTTQCPRGFKQNACTSYEDANCRVPCSDETKPLQNSLWINDCYWDCEPGYTKFLKEYPGWTEYVCEKSDPNDLPWSIGM